MLEGGQARKVEGNVRLELPAKLTIVAPKEKLAKR
jgi:hypothetical protein